MVAIGRRTRVSDGEGNFAFVHNFGGRARVSPYQRDAAVDLLARGEVEERAIVRRALGHAELRHDGLYLRTEPVRKFGERLLKLSDRIR